MSCVELYFTDSDEEDSAYNVAVKRIQIRDKTNPLELPNNLFHKYFRLNKEAFRLLLIKIEEKLKPSTRSCSVTPMIKLAATLRFFAEGGYQTGTGNEFIAGLAQSTFSKILSQVCDVLVEQICPEYIKFPTTDGEKERIKLAFFKFGFPGVIGCVDGTHVKIIAPPKRERHLYINRKGFYSLNVMLVCDDRIMRITYVDANHPGSCHDSFIFNSSELDTQLKTSHDNGLTNTWLIGDSGYALKPYVITPFRSAEGESQEKRFNTKHAKVRNIIERTIGIFKNRFRCLLGARQLHYTPQKATQIINISCALHNLCISQNMEFEIQEPSTDDETEPVEPEETESSPGAQRIREQIMNSIC